MDHSGSSAPGQLVTLVYRGKINDLTLCMTLILILILMVCSSKPLLGHHALVRVVGFRMAGFMLSGSGIRVCVLGNVELGWGGWGKVQFNVGG